MHTHIHILHKYGILITFQLNLRELRKIKFQPDKKNWEKFEKTNQYEENEKQILFSTHFSTIFIVLEFLEYIKDLFQVVKYINLI